MRDIASLGMMGQGLGSEKGWEGPIMIFGAYRRSLWWDSRPIRGSGDDFEAHRALRSWADTGAVPERIVLCILVKVVFCVPHS